MSFPARIIDDPEGITALLARTRRVAVLGIKTEAQADQPAFYVPRYLVEAGFEIVPVPVYYPDATAILGRPVVRRVAEISPPVDMVDVFRRSKDLAAHLEDLLAARPRSVWLQKGIRDAAFAARLVAAGISVVEDRCLMVEVRARPPRAAG
jgi:predicted CoA-binding protein